MSGAGEDIWILYLLLCQHVKAYRSLILFNCSFSYDGVDLSPVAGLHVAFHENINRLVVLEILPAKPVVWAKTVALHKAFAHVHLPTKSFT